VPVLDAVRPLFHAIAETVVPEASHLDSSGWQDVEAIVESALRQRPARLRRQLGILLRAIDWLPLLRYGRRFTALSAPQRVAFLSSLQRAPLLLLRRGFWGLRTLILMGYYARPTAGVEIGYRGDPRGWEARR